MPAVWRFHTMNQFQAFDLLPAQIAVLDQQGTIVFTNQTWDTTADRLLPKRRWNYLQECAAALDRGCADGRFVGDGIGKILRREINEFVAVYACPFDRHHHWFQISVRRSRASDAGIGAVVMHTNVTALQHDHLTGLANRALFEAQAQYVLELARQNGAAAGLALVDLDGFKPVNDEFGHAAGDKVLVELAYRLTSVTTKEELVARLGGDEFGIVTGIGCSAVALERLSRNLQRVFKEPYSVDHTHCYLSGSIGTALYPEDGTTLELLLKSADSRMYGMKRALKSRHSSFGPEHGGELKRHFSRRGSKQGVKTL
jgi:diguanylate cyclase (GGDEF)-like protein